MSYTQLTVSSFLVSGELFALKTGFINASHLIVTVLFQRLRDLDKLLCSGCSIFHA